MVNEAIGTSGRLTTDGDGEATICLLAKRLEQLAENNRLIDASAFMRNGRFAKAIAGDQLAGGKGQRRWFNA